MPTWQVKPPRQTASASLAGQLGLAAEVARRAAYRDRADAWPQDLDLRAELLDDGDHRLEGPRRRAVQPLRRIVRPLRRAARALRHLD